MSRRVVVLTNPSKPDAVEARQIVERIVREHAELVASEDASLDGPPGAASDAEIAVVLGGDGTLLTQTRRLLDAGLTMLGINFGKLGFLAEFDVESFEKQAPAILDGGAITRTLGLLHVELVRNGSTAFAQEAINECVVTAGPPFRMIDLALRVDQGRGPVVSGDGMIVSSPIGSTAYTLSAGGPILAPDADAMAVTPIAPHSLSFRPFVVAGCSTVEIELLRINDDECGGGTTLVLDGQIPTRVQAGDRVRVSRSDKTIRSIRNPEADYWQTLIDKLNWALPPTPRGHGRNHDD
ncbi:MAG: NAD(+)/NADH kinase [Planctomycetota bacterium]